MSSIRSRHAAAAVLVATAALPASPGALAQDAGARLNQSIWLQVAAFRPDLRSTVRIDDAAADLNGTALSLERDLGLADSKSVGALLVGVRLGERWRGEFETFRLSRSGQRRIDTSFTIGDTVYDATALLTSEFDTTVHRLSAGYSLLRTPTAEAGLTVGLHVTRFDFAVQGDGSVGGQPATLRRERADGTAPLPTIGLYGTWAFAPNWAANARLDYFAIHHDGYDGRLVNLQGTVFYRVSPNLALGLGWRQDDYRLGIARGELAGQIDYRFRGPQLLIDIGF